MTRSARLKPAWTIVDDITGVNGKVRRVTVASPPPASYPPELIDRTRIFQNAIAQLQPDGWGTVDLAINDVIPEGEEARTEPRARNYCERQGRCNIGCLPGARHTLNTQLMRAVFGNFRAADFDPQAPKDPPPVLKQVSVELWPLTEVDSISLRSGGGYRVKCRRRSAAEPTAAETVVVEATRVIVAAGCLGTTELMLRSREQGRSSGDGMGLPDLSEKVGFGFSPNGDYLAFLDGTRERVNLTRGPVTTSFGHFNANSPKADGFHNIEDQGIPRSLAALIGYGMPVIQGLFRGHETLLKLPGTFLGIFGALRNLFSPYPKRRTLPTQPEDLSGHRPDSEDEFTASMMCIAAQGKDQANGQFRLERDRLRVRRTDGRSFAEDPIYRTLRATLARLAEKLRPSGSAAEFISPFTDVALGDQPPVIGTSHPLGGCPMGRDISEGVVDEFGRVFRAKRATTPASSDFYPGLYIADATVIPTALGVNPSLTISAIALRVADNIVAEWETIGVR